MNYSSNPAIQQLMDEAAALDSSSDNIEQKLQLIAEAVAAQQRHENAGASQTDFAPSDPQDAFSCEGCQ